MGTKELEWQKYDKRLVEIERRLARPAARLEIKEVAPARRSSAIDIVAEEINFIKAEAEQAGREKEEALKAARAAETLSGEKDSEIIKLYARNKQLEDENYSLRLRVNKHLFETAEREHRRKREKDGFASWLKKPLVRIESVK